MAERSAGEPFGAFPTSRRGFLRAASALGAAGLAVGALGPPRGQAAPLATVRGVLRGRLDAVSAGFEDGERTGLAVIGPEAPTGSGWPARLVPVASAARFRSAVLPLEVQ